MTFPLSLAPRLPYDIVISVIEVLLAESCNSAECINVLQTFSLVSESFVAFCQKRLFRRFNMGRTDSKKCFAILQRSPHLIPYVEEVWMDVGGRGVVHVTVAEMELLRVLTSLSHLTVSFYKTWADLSVSVRRTITSLLLPRRITSLALIGVQALPDGLLTTWRHLKSLHIWDENPHQSLHVYSDSEPDSDDEDAYTRFGDALAFFSPPATTREDAVAVRLETLSLFNSDNMLRSLLVDADKLSKNEALFSAPRNGSPDPQRAHGLAGAHTYGLFQAKYDLPSFYFDFSLLREFAIDIIETNLLPAFSIIHHARNTLETLDIRQRYFDHIRKDPFGFDSTLLADSSKPLPDEVSLEALIQLQRLSITILIVSEYTPLHLNALSSWCALLRRAPRGIRTLEIILDAFFVHSVLCLLPWFPDLDDADDDDAAHTPLSTLDAIIADADAFPCLAHVSLRVRLPEDDPRGSEGGMTVDVVDDEDFAVVRAWLAQPRYYDAEAGAEPGATPGDSGGRAPAGVDGDALTADNLAVHGAACAADARARESARTPSWPADSDPDLDDVSSRAYPLPFERVAASVGRMMRRTTGRFGAGGAFVVAVEFGAHPEGRGANRDWGYDRWRRGGWMEDAFAYS